MQLDGLKSLPGSSWGYFRSWGYFKKETGGR